MRLMQHVMTLPRQVEVVEQERNVMGASGLQPVDGNAGGVGEGAERILRICPGEPRLGADRVNMT